MAKLRLRHRKLVWLAVWAYAGIALASAPGVVLCIEPGCHVALEAPHELSDVEPPSGHCDDESPCAALQSPGESHHGDCVDLVFPTSIALTRRSGNRLSAAADLVCSGDLIRAGLYGDGAVCGELFVHRCSPPLSSPVSLVAQSLRATVLLH